MAPAVQERPQPQRTPESIKGRVVIVTGGATGLGRAVALEFAQNGCGVAFNYVEMPGREVGPQALLTETAIKAYGVPCYSALCDVREMELVEHFVSQGRSCGSRLGRYQCERRCSRIREDRIADATAA